MNRNQKIDAIYDYCRPIPRVNGDCVKGKCVLFDLCGEYIFKSAPDRILDEAMDLIRGKGWKK